MIHFRVKNFSIESDQTNIETIAISHKLKPRIVWMWGRIFRWINGPHSFEEKHKILYHFNKPKCFDTIVDLMSFVLAFYRWHSTAESAIFIFHHHSILMVSKHFWEISIGFCIIFSFIFQMLFYFECCVNLLWMISLYRSILVVISSLIKWLV